MDASLDPFDVNTARMVNDSPNTEANATMKIVPVWNQPRLCLFALRDIAKGDEIRYDYGVPGLPWRKVFHHCDTSSYREELHVYDLSYEGVLHVRDYARYSLKGPEKKKFKRELAVPNPRLSDLTFCGLYEKSFSLNKDKSALKETCAATAIEKDDTSASFGKMQAVTKGAVGEPEDSSDSTQYPLFSACSTSVKIGKGTTDQKPNTDKSPLKETCAATAIEKDETSASFGKVQAVTKGAVGEPEDSSDSTQYPLFSACSTSVKIGKGTTDQKPNTDKSPLKETCAATAIEKDETSASFGKLQAVTKGAVGEPEDSSDSTQYPLFSACSTGFPPLFNQMLPHPDKPVKPLTQSHADTWPTSHRSIPGFPLKQQQLPLLESLV